MAFLASLFGYLLNFIYDLVNNYGLAIIIFTIIIKLLMLPISIKQQKIYIFRKNLKILIMLGIDLFLRSYSPCN